VLRGWARSALGDPAEGISWIEHGIAEFQATGSKLERFLLALKAEALHLADRTSEAIEAIKAAEEVVERSEVRQWSAELHRLRGVFLATLGAEETQIEASFCAAISIAREQKSIFLEKRAAATYAECFAGKPNERKALISARNKGQRFGLRGKMPGELPAKGQGDEEY
jgi:hypothetical protein